MDLRDKVDFTGSFDDIYIEDMVDATPNSMLLNVTTSLGFRDTNDVMVGYLLDCLVAIMEEPANTRLPGDTVMSYVSGIVTWEPDPNKMRPSRAPFSIDCPIDTKSLITLVILPCISRVSMSPSSVEMVIR